MPAETRRSKAPCMVGIIILASREAYPVPQDHINLQYTQEQKTVLSMY
jgi:hypothetical protein